MSHKDENNVQSKGIIESSVMNTSDSAYESRGGKNGYGVREKHQESKHVNCNINIS